MNDNTRPWYFWPVIAFLVGLLVGWLVIGWLVWPVTWTNAQLRDLRPDLRYEYVAMVAESYAQTRNIEQARARLGGWPEADLGKDLTAAQEVFAARNLQTAQNVQELAVALGVTTTPGAGGAAAGQQPAQQPGQQPAPQPAQQPAAAGGVSTLRQVCTAGLFILLAAGALALLVWLFRRWRNTSAGPAVASTASYADYDAAATAADEEKGRWPAQATAADDVAVSRGGYATPAVKPYLPDDDLATPDVVQPPAQTPLRPVGQAPVEPSRNETPPGRPPVPPPPAVAAAAATTGSLKRLVETTAVYQMGEPDYDEAFDITDPADGFMGQYGLQLIEPFGRERDQAVALQVWLWDSSDPDTQALVLMSEGAYRDTALRSQHAADHQAVSVRPGAEFELASHDLLLKGRVEKASYAEADPPRTIFADLHVKLTVYRRA